MPASSATTPYPQPAIVLVRPQLPENIGMVARAMGNFALTDLRLVAPREIFPHPQATAAAAGAAAWLEKAQVFDSVEDAIADLTCVLATTARPRSQFKSVLAPLAAVEKLDGFSKQRLATGVLFGAERTGLTNDELVLADAILTFPISAEYTSLNLSQAVLLFGYHWFAGKAGNNAPFAHVPLSKLASKGQFHAFMARMDEALESKSYYYPPNKKTLMQRNLHNILQRIGPTEQDLRTLHGVLSSLLREKKEI